MHDVGQKHERGISSRIASDISLIHSSAWGPIAAAPMTTARCRSAQSVTRSKQMPHMPASRSRTNRAAAPTLASSL
jgi:hypothetical protein